jgi:cytochrome d ubiquinol oxidase subunit II
LFTKLQLLKQQIEANMIEVTVFFIGISLLLYVLLGGADYGAGIIEIFTGKKGIGTISNAIAPVWEANHIWIIVVLVILFNAFPDVYSTVTKYLHIPVMLVLIGIIFRGTSFAFRYYDPYEDRSHRIYSFIFQLFSLLTPFFLGITLGAVILGKITTDNTLPFYNRFVAPWLNPFSIVLGIFIVLLFAYLAAVYLIGESSVRDERKQFSKYAIRLLAGLVFTGVCVFVSAQFSGMPLSQMYLGSWLSMSCAIIATLLLPAFIYTLKREMKNLMRIVAGAQTVSILIGWFAIQFPVMVRLQNASSLTVYNAAAPPRSLLMMIIALVVGLAVVIPLLLYLFRVFKFSKNQISE